MANDVQKTLENTANPSPAQKLYKITVLVVSQNTYPLFTLIYLKLLKQIYCDI